MPAYVIVDISVKDPVRYEEYKKLAAETVKAYGGKYIVRGNPIEVLEGNWKPERFVILEFPSSRQAKTWWSSQEYARPKKLRQEITKTNMILVENV